MNFTRFKSFIKSWIPPNLIPMIKFVAGKTPNQLIRRYLEHGRIPWSPGYALYKEHIILDSLQNQELLDGFKEKNKLPKKYGLGVDERCIEYPWLFSHLPIQALHILDAGSILNHEYLLSQSYFSDKDLHIVTLAPEASCFWRKRISYLFADLRSLPIKDGFYDVVVCLSTLEHIGLDNTQYFSGKRHDENKVDDFKVALKELRRVLKPGGSLFLSLPFGQYQNFGHFQQFDSRLLAESINTFEPCQLIQKTFFKYSKDGWQVVSEHECNDCLYSEFIDCTASGGHRNNLIGNNAQGDLAAAARAVVCIHFIL